MECVKRNKTFTGCWTCRARKVRCDLRRPGCERCEKSGLICGGYDVKLRWTRPIQFDTYGNVSVTPLGPKDPDAPQYQRRKVDHVHYKEEYVYHEDMDDELSALSSPPLELIADNKTWIIKKFGVFKGTDKVKKKYVPRKKRKRNEVFITAIKKAQKKIANAAKKTDKSLSGSISDESEPLTNGSAVSSAGLFDFDMNSLLFPGNEWISNELRDDALLSASAMQGQTMPFSKLLAKQRLEGSNTPYILDHRAPKREASGITSPIVDANDLNKVYRLLFHRSGNSDSVELPNSTVNETHPDRSKDFMAVVPLKDSVELSIPGSTMPSSVVDIIHGPVVDPSIFNLPGNTNRLLEVPVTGVLVHGLARFLLNYYLQNVADLMTVVVLPTNPWKTIYFPRALKALGDITGIGYTSNSRNSLLNALLAVSCFNLQSKFPKNSPEMKFFLSLGIEFRTQASNFLKRCFATTVSQERYKDLLTAILSMNSIDVVWGTMADCQVHLTICEDFVEKRMRSRPKISAKAKSLHRIFSFLKLIQDSTALDKVRPKEIVISDNKLHSNLVTEQDINSVNGSFKESLNEEDGKIRIEFVEAKASTPEGCQNTEANDKCNIQTTPIFSNIASASYYYPKSSDKTSDILSTDALYGLPNSLILLFSDCVRLARHKEYYRQHGIAVPTVFENLCTEFKQRIHAWTSEWNFRQSESKEKFLNDTVEGVYHHTMSFYNGLIIYFYTVVMNSQYQKVENYVKKVLEHLNELTLLIENKSVKIVPLIWQGFMAGCACIDINLQLEFKEWAAKLVKTGMGSYWGARQIMFEVWRRRFNNEPHDTWFAVYKDWEMNLMLS